VRVLVVGGGGREHALVWKLAGERDVGEVLCAPGNAGIARVARCGNVDAGDPAALLALAEREQIDLTVIGPELPLARGVVDRFAREGRLAFGPQQVAAQLETSKVFAKAFMARHRIPTAHYLACDTHSDAVDAIRGGEFGFPVVIKADGLAAGKGVTVALDRAEAESALMAAMVERQFGAAGARVVIEEYMAGEEASFFALCDGRRAIPMGSAQDHKRAFDNDEGPNTGGMGVFAPSPHFDAGLEARVMREIVDPVIGGLAEEGAEYRGFLYAGLMLTADGPRVVEFNVRLGDPEAQVVLPMMYDDLAPLIAAAAAGALKRKEIRFRSEPHVGVVLASGGYPGNYETGQRIDGIDAAERLDDVLVFHAGTTRRNADIVTSGGRVLTVVGRGPDYATAIARAYDGVAQISFEGQHYRRDIGRKALVCPKS
jgi:phosphoribosylamine--glycine ligase